MADSLVLKGVKDVRKHTGTEMLLTNPRRGGNTHQVKEWWRVGGVNTTYTACTIFNVTTAAGTVKLVLATGKSEDCDIRIDHDGNFNFSFYQINEIDRAALFTDAMELIEHYVFPSIAGGPVMTVTPASGASRPSAPPPAPTIGTVTLSGQQSPTDGNTETYTVSISGDASPTYVLTSSDSNDTIAGLNVTFNGAGARTLTVTATDAAASDNPAIGTLAINAAATIIGTVTITGEQAPNDGDTETYTVSISGDASPTYVLTSSDVNDTVSGLDVTYSGAGTRTLTVTATDAAASDSPATGTLAINATVFFATRVANADLSVAVTVADTGYGNKYQIDGVEQDTLVANAGATIHFDLSDASLSGHPFGIYTDSSKTTQVTVGVEQQGTDLLFTPPIAGSFSYQCSAHAGMGGDIIVS